VLPQFSVAAARAAAAVSAAATHGARGFFARAGSGESGKFLGNFRGTAVRAFRPLPVGGADEDFAVVFALLTMESVNRHEVTLFRRAKISSAGFNFCQELLRNRFPHLCQQNTCSVLTDSTVVPFCYSIN
jgi:hypothetical protein